MADVKETPNAKAYEDAASGERHLNQYILQKIIGQGSFGTVHLAVDTSQSGRKFAIKEFSKIRLRRNKLSREGGGAFGLRGRFRGRGGRGRGGVGAGVTHSQMNSWSSAPSLTSPQSPGSPSGTTIAASTFTSSPPGSGSSTPNSIDLVRGEIAILKKLRHRNIVRLYEVLDDPDDDSLFMVYELCENGALMDVSLEKSAEPFSEEQARIYMHQILLVHENDIVHRDIKPDNLLIDGNGVLKIVDFGVSEMFSKGNDKSKRSAGSPAFFAPEMCMAQHGELSAKATDMWAIGVTLYCMIFGCLPFPGPSIVDLYEHIKTKEPEIPPGTNPTLVDLFSKITTTMLLVAFVLLTKPNAFMALRLQKDPSKRITMDELRVHPWITNNGTDPPLSKEENCVGLVTFITEEELKNAVKNINKLYYVLKAVSKLKRHSKSMTNLNERHSSSSSSSSSTTSLYQQFLQPQPHTNIQPDPTVSDSDTTNGNIHNGSILLE
ncbi:hypothetical protein HK102_010746 [Quaeritorhiza haematococci]|nr:hypothetical protein HK102_010746 [Quaeritorhiza haematococci]